MMELLNLGACDNQVVLFADLLGFSQTVLNNAETTMESKGGIVVNLPRIYNIIAGCDYSKDYQSKRCIKFNWVSDSIVITTTADNINAVLTELCKLINIFYCSGFSLRGAITYGKVYHEDNIWGPAFVKAVQYEKRAMFPRVVIKTEDMKRFPISTEFFEFFKLTENPDFMWFDYFDYHLSIAEEKAKDISASLHVYSKFIADNICSAEDDKTIGKYIWLANCFTHSVVKHGTFINSLESISNYQELINNVSSSMLSR